MTSGGNSLTLGLTLTDKTYVEKGAVAAENDFDGKTFQGSWTDDGEGYFIKVTFGKSGAVNVLIKYGINGTGSTAYPFSSNTESDTYVINSDGTISLTMHDGSSEKVLVLTPNEAKTTLTIDKDFNNGYKTKGVVLSLVL